MCLKKVMLLLSLTVPLLVHAQQTESERQLSVELTKVSAVINSQGPKKLDDETRLDSVATYKNVMIYNNTMVNYTAAQLNVELFDPVIKETVIDSLCSNKALKAFIGAGVVMVYRYHGKEGVFITEQSKDMSTCN